MITERKCDGCGVKSEDVSEYGFDGLDFCTPCWLKTSIAEHKKEYKDARKHIYDVHIAKLKRIRSHIKALELKLEDL